VLLGVGDDPAELVGHGPIDADLARTLAQDATWRRLLTDADDEAYAALCGELSSASQGVSLALDQGDAAAVGRAVGAIQQACNKCHENYR